MNNRHEKYIGELIKRYHLFISLAVSFMIGFFISIVTLMIEIVGNHKRFTLLGLLLLAAIISFLLACYWYRLNYNKLRDQVEVLRPKHDD